MIPFDLKIERTFRHIRLYIAMDDQKNLTVVVEVVATPIPTQMGHVGAFNLHC